MWGPLAAALGVTQALLAIIILEDVNYIEHYGLQRALTRTGRHATASPNLRMRSGSRRRAAQPCCTACMQACMLVPPMTCLW